MRKVPVTPNSDGTVDFARFFFLLPEPLAVPASTLLTDQVGNDPASFEPLSDDPIVWLRFHQREGHGRTRAAEALISVVEEALDLDQSDRNGDLPPLAPYTIAEAITAFASTDPAPDNWAGKAHLLTPRSDAFMRCLRLVDDHARAYRLATSSPYGRVTYERTPSPVFAYRTPVCAGEELDPSTAEWSGPMVMVLEHTNTIDPILGPVIEDSTAEHVDYWLREIRHGSALVRWRELLLDAKNAVTSAGDTAMGAILGQTASEVFVDSLLQLLMWEEGLDAVDAAGLFAEGKVVARTKREFAKRLGGAWITEGNGPLAAWVRDSSRLRHRVVHGGYQPSQIETEGAITAIEGLEQFVFERLVAKRNEYPRTTLMTVAQPGLERRGLWGGKIKRFADNVAVDEPSWSAAFYAWRSALVTEQLRSANS